MKSKAQKRQEAAERALERDKRSPDEQRRLLDRRLGKGQGAARERARLTRTAG